MRAAEHPLVKRHIERSERLSSTALAIADELASFALRYTLKCPLPEDYGCACTGACTNTPEYRAIMGMAYRLREAAEPTEEERKHDGK